MSLLVSRVSTHCFEMMSSAAETIAPLPPTSSHAQRRSVWHMRADATPAESEPRTRDDDIHFCSVQSRSRLSDVVASPSLPVCPQRRGCMQAGTVSHIWLVPPAPPTVRSSTSVRILQPAAQRGWTPRDRGSSCKSCFSYVTVGVVVVVGRPGVPQPPSSSEQWLWCCFRK